jgi:hypothetical protein
MGPPQPLTIPPATHAFPSAHGQRRADCRALGSKGGQKARHTSTAQEQNRKARFISNICQYFALPIAA